MVDEGAFIALNEKGLSSWTNEKEEEEEEEEVVAVIEGFGNRQRTIEK